MSWETIVKKYRVDASEVFLSNLFGSFRLDPEAYQKIYIEAEKIVSQRKMTSLKSQGIIVDASAFYPSIEPYYNSGELPFLRVADIKEKIKYETATTIPYEIANKYKTLKVLEAGDLVLTKGGTIGNVGLITRPSAVSRDLVFLKTSSLSKEKQVLLFFFLQTALAKNLVLRSSSMSVQAHLTVIMIRELPCISLDTNPIFEKELYSLYQNALKKEEFSVNYYRDAENILLKELGLETHIPSEVAISVRVLNECLRGNRFDAEYWQPEYDEVIKIINSYKLGASTIGDEFKQLKSNFKPEAKQEYKYVEIGDINVSTGEVDSNVILGKELPANAKILFGKKQLVTSKVRPNRGATAILDNHEGFIGSGAFVVLQERQSINLETLMVYLKLQPIRDLLLRYNTGTSYPTITDGDVLKLPIPLVDKQVQEKISELLVTSKRQRLEAKELLEKAKRAVEVFIEKDEAEALKLLNN